jgi:DNA helicase IV
VVVVSPSNIDEELDRGLQALFVALTRAVQHLSVVRARPLPAPLLD